MIQKLIFLSLLYFGIFSGVRSQDILSLINEEKIIEVFNETLEVVKNITNDTLLELPLLSQNDTLNFDQIKLRNLRAKNQKKYHCSFKCIISDLDGSLAEIGQTSVTDSNLATLEDIMKSNMHFFLSTGRSYTSAMKFINNNRSSTFNGFPGVYYNGALVLGQGGLNDVLFETRIQLSNALEIMKFIHSFAIFNENFLRFESNQQGTTRYISLSKEDSRYVNKTIGSNIRLLNVAIEDGTATYVDGSNNEYMEKYLSQEVDNLVHKGVNIQKFLEQREGENKKEIFKIVIAESPEILVLLRENLESFVRIYGCKVYRSVPHILEIIPENASKLSGSKLILKKLKVKTNEVAYLGDGENDIDPMSKFGFPIATKGSSPAVTYVSRAVQMMSPETSLSSLINEHCKTMETCRKD